MKVFNIKHTPENHGTGETGKEKEAELFPAKKKAMALNIVSIAAGIAAITGMNISASSGSAPLYLKILTGFCSIMPVLALILYRSSRDVIEIEYRRKSGRKSLLVCFLMPLIILTPSRFNYDVRIINYTEIIKPAAAVILAIIIVFYNLLKSKDSRKEEFFFRRGFMLFYAAVFAFGFIITGNWVFNKSGAVEYKPKIVEIIRPHTRRSKTSYYFNLEGWGPVGGINMIRVPYSIYHKKHPGDTLSILLYDGFYGIRYYILTGESPAEPGKESNL